LVGANILKAYKEILDDYIASNWFEKSKSY
jgi:hypothetical protein